MSRGISDSGRFEPVIEVEAATCPQCAEETPAIPPDSGIEVDKRGPFLLATGFVSCVAGDEMRDGVEPRSVVIRDRRIIAAMQMAALDVVIMDEDSSNEEVVAAEGAQDYWRSVWSKGG